MPVPIVRVPGHSTHTASKHQITVSEDGAAPPRFHRLGNTLPVSPPPSFGSREEWINSLPTWRRMKHRWTGEEDSNMYGERCEGELFFRQGLADADNASVIKGQRTQVYTPPTPCQHDEMAADDEDVEMLPEYSTPDNDSPCNDFSPRRDVSSSPIGPITPLQDYVDRAISAVDPSPSFYTVERPGVLRVEASFPRIEDAKPAHSKVPPCAVAGSTPPQPSSDSYKKLVHPLSEWLAEYMWQRCFPDVSPRSNSMALSNLATSIHSLLLSTLLQPSAIFLALWYIGRLPSRGMSEDVQQIKELLFRQEVLGSHAACSATDASIPFRLFVLGCMLANKWLDDHTFSNKTWHSITSIPIQSINRLEALALDIFMYDLSISRAQWAEWLASIKMYHLSLSSGYIQPISRPSSNPQSIIRKAIEDLIRASSASHSNIEPSFIGLDERKQEQIFRAQEQAKASAALDIDLDEDGPLREEYKPKRRYDEAAVGVDGTMNNPTAARLPPPSKWSPAGDEPISRERNGRGLPSSNPMQPDYSAGRFVPVAYSSYGYTGYGTGVWSVHSYVAPKPAPYAYHPQPYLPMNSVYTASSFYPHAQLPSYNMAQHYGHSKWCSYTHPRFEHQCSDIRTTANAMFCSNSPPSDNIWQARGFFSAGAPAMYPPSWIRT